jgi:hypothetical protein
VALHPWWQQWQHCCQPPPAPAAAAAAGPALPLSAGRLPGPGAGAAVSPGPPCSSSSSSSSEQAGAAAAVKGEQQQYTGKLRRLLTTSKPQCTCLPTFKRQEPQHGCVPVHMTAQPYTCQLFSTLPCPPKQPLPIFLSMPLSYLWGSGGLLGAQSTSPSSLTG